jgi:hypothetical protein
VSAARRAILCRRSGSGAKKGGAFSEKPDRKSRKKTLSRSPQFSAVISMLCLSAIGP